MRKTINTDLAKWKSKFIKIITSLTTILLILIFPLYIKAVSMDSSSFRIESASINNAAGNKTSDNYKLSDTLGQLAAGEFSSTGYIVKAGFQYLHSIIPFRFSISNININLGTLMPNTPSTDTTTLTVYFGGAGQYQVTAAEIGKLRTLNDAANIPNTSCNGGADTCTTSQAKVWTSSTAYGFGYNMTGNDIPSDFINSTYYRPFADRNLSEAEAVVMSSPNVGKNRASTMTFKANISNVQPAGSYQTVINFVATPSY